MTRIVTLGGLLAAALAVCVSAQDVEPKYKPKVYKTPEDCFNAVVKALEKREFRTLVDALTPAAQKGMAVQMAVQGNFHRREAEGRLLKDEKDKAEKNEELMKKYKPLFDVMDKHGLTEKAMKDVEISGFRVTKQGREAVEKLIKDPAAFLLAFMTAQTKALPENTPSKDEPKPKLADLKIDGDKATANVVTTIRRRTKEKDKDKEDVTEQKHPVTFEKINGGWRVDPQPNRKDADAPTKDKVEK